jgi:hypothetical protein
MKRSLSSFLLLLTFVLLGCPHGAKAQGVAPYIDMSITADENIVSIASSTGLKSFTLAFLDAVGACNLGWAGLGGALPTDTLANGTSMLTIVQQLKSAGVTPIFSIGGADGVDAAAYCTSASSLQAVYQNAVSRYGITYLDFDIEGAAVAMPAQITMRDQALVGLKNANPGLIISYTIPVEPTGLVAGDGLNLLSSAKSDGVALSVVNIMTMDFGSSGIEMGNASTQAAAAVHGQIQAAGLSSTVGITPMIGQNDSGGEIFTLADATTVVNFAKANSYVSRLAFWSVGRDNGSCAGSGSASPSCSGISQSTNQFAGIFNGFSGSGGSGGGGGGGGTEGPYGGTPAAIPGTVMAENYDTGGSGLGYSVSSTNGSANSYRSDGVDLEAATSPATGNDLGWSASGQWFRYTVNVATAGTYTVSILVASPTAVGDAFHLSNSSGTNLSGSVAVPATGGYQTWVTVTANVTLPAGKQTLTLNQDAAGWNIDSLKFATSGGGGSCTTKPNAPTGLAASGTSSTGTNLNWTATTAPANCSISSYTVLKGGVSIGTATGTSFGVSGLTASTNYSFTVEATDAAGTSAASSAVSVTTTASGGGEGPYPGPSAAAVPGTVMNENYDTGGQGVAYNVTSTNGTANSYRAQGVDLEAASSPATGNDLGWSAAGQWFRYTVNVSTAGSYKISFLVASPTAIGDAFHISNSSGTNLTGSVAVPATGGYQTWVTVTANVTLSAGTQTLTLNEDAAGWNIDSMVFASSGGGGGGSVTLSPSSYNFGSVAHGAGTGWVTFTLTNGGSSAVSISSVTVSGPFVVSSNCGSSVAASSSCPIYVYFAPTVAGAATGTLTVNDNGSNSPQTSALSGTGT